jgi:hypothetical protein
VFFLLELEAPARPGLFFICRRQLLAKAAIVARASPRGHASEGAIFVVPKGEHPHLRRSHRPGIGVEDAANDNAVGEHVEVVIIPFAGRREADARLRTCKVFARSGSQR